MRRVVRVGILVTGMATTAAPATACAPQSVRQQSERAPVIFTGTVVAGPTTPARIWVEQWERGKGPQEVSVDTGIYDDASFDESISPEPGERWRIYGTWHDGVVITGLCYGSHEVATPPNPPTFALGTASAFGIRASFAGRPLSGDLPLLDAVAGATKTLRVASWVRDVRLVGARGGAKLTSSKGKWTLRLPVGGKPRGTLVADTGDAFFAVKLRVLRKR